MKKVFVSMLALAALASCSSEEVLNEPVDGNKPVEIKLTAGVLDVTTKAPINTNSKFLPGIAGWEGTQTPAAGTEIWVTEPDADITAGTAQPVVLKDKKYYNPDGATETFICAYYPKSTAAVTLDAPQATFTNTDGSVDVMYASVTSAGKKPAGATAPTATALTFEHQLTQLKFMVKGNASVPSDLKVTTLKVKNVKLPTGLNIFTGELTTSAAQDIPASNLKTDAIPTGDQATAIEYADPIMVAPLNTTDIKLDITTSDGVTFTDVPVTLDANDGNTGGTSFAITLTFQQKEITATSTVTEWTTQTGSGTVQ